MILQHYTDLVSALAIDREGLDPDKAKGKQRCVWLVEPYSAWELRRHLERQRGVPDGGWVVFDVSVKREWLIHSGTPGRWKCFRKIPATRCRSERLCFLLGRKRVKASGWLGTRGPVRKG